MVKITYDLNNAEQCQKVEDYFFYKYYIESLKFDWGHYDWYYTEWSEVENIIYKSLNKSELERAVEMYKNDLMIFLETDDLEPYQINGKTISHAFLYSVLRKRYEYKITPLDICKFNLIKYFKNK